MFSMPKNLAHSLVLIVWLLSTTDARSQGGFLYPHQFAASSSLFGASSLHGLTPQSNIPHLHIAPVFNSFPSALPTATTFNILPTTPTFSTFTLSPSPISFHSSPTVNIFPKSNSFPASSAFNNFPVASPAYNTAPTVAPNVAIQTATLPTIAPKSRLNKSNNNIIDGTLNFFNPLNFAVSTVDSNYLPGYESYIVDGRVLKQYSVQEQLDDDVMPPTELGLNPILLSDYQNLYNKYTITNQDFYRIRGSNGQTSIIQPVTRNHGPVALGSGSLGYIRTRNGAVFLGSGSLGYISSQERVTAVNDARTRKNIQASPINFGDSIPQNQYQ